MSILSFLKPKTSQESTQDTETTQKGTSTTQQDTTKSAEQTSEATSKSTSILDTINKVLGVSTSTGTQAGTTAGVTTQQAQQFNDPAIRLLEEVFGSAGIGAQGALEGTQSLAALATERAGAFDESRFIQDTLAAAQQRFESQTSRSLNTLNSAIGGTAQDNSAAALIAGQLESENAARLAGVRSDAVRTAGDIRRADVAQAGGLQSLGFEQFLQIAGELRGAVSSQTGTQTGESATSTAAAGTTGQESTGKQTSQATTAEQASQSLLEIINALVQTEQEASGTSKSKGTGQQTGSVFDGLLSLSQTAKNIGDAFG